MEGERAGVKIARAYSVVSFFAGCGGLDLGLRGGFEYKGEKIRRLPFKIEVAYDNDAKCVETYRRNIGNHAEIADLEKMDVGKMPAAEVLVGGFPCQDFSSCGPKAGLKSKRGRLYRTLIRYMSTHRPKIVLAENVPHLARMRQGAILKTIVEEFEEAGYKIEVWRLSARDYGIPQNRSRLFFVGVRDDLPGFPRPPEPTHTENPRSIDWAIEDLVAIVDESVPNQSQYFKASNAKRGNGQGDERNKAGFPSYTIRANAKSRVQYHYHLDRRLTVRECARLQTFPDDFVFPHSATANVMQVGNAVPPLLAYQVAKSIADFLKRLKGV